MDQSFSQQDNSIEKQHPKPNPENYTQSRSNNTSDYDPSVSKSNSNFHKPFPSAQEQSNKASFPLNYSENNTEHQANKQGSKVKNELEAVPEISVEYSQITNKTSQLDELLKGRPEYDNENRNLTKSKRNLAKAYYDYQPHSISTSKSLDFKIERDLQNAIGKPYVSPTAKVASGEDQVSKYRDNKDKRFARESISTSKQYKYHDFSNNNSSSIYEKPGAIEKDKSSRFDMQLKGSESMSKLSKSDFQSRDFRGSMSFQGQDKEIKKLRDENEKLTERLRVREKELQESKKHNDEFYRKYRDIQNELSNYQREKEALLAEKVKFVQLEHRESVTKKEADELRQNDSQKNKMIRDLQAQVSSLKADITFLNQKSEAKLEAMRMEGQRLEEENSRLMQSMRKSESKRDNLIHQLEMSYDEEKSSLRKHLQQSISQLQLMTNKNDDLSHKIERLSKQNIKKERALLEKMDESSYENKKYLEEQISQAREEISQHFQTKLHSLQGKISRLSSENENLKLELQSKPSLRKFKEYEFKIHTLETELENTKEHHVQEHRKRPSEVGLPAKILKEVAEELEVESIGEILPKIVDIKHEHKADSKLVHSLLDLVNRCSPPGYFERDPTHKQAWAWIKNIMEEYMILKKQEEGSKPETKRDILGTVMDFLNVKDVHEVPKKLSQILGDNIGMSKVISKVKVLHKLEWVNSLNELEQRIQSEINAKYDDPYLRFSYYKRNNS